jgi:F0F1-type ATP synthase assembly protein I
MNEPEKNSNEEASNGNSEKSWMLQLGRYSQIGFALPAATGVGWLLGTLLDRYLHTSWLYLAGLLCGIAGGFIELIRVTHRSDRSGDAK